MGQVLLLAVPWRKSEEKKNNKNNNYYYFFLFKVAVVRNVGISSNECVGGPCRRDQ